MSPQNIISQDYWWVREKGITYTRVYKYSFFTTERITKLFIFLSRKKYFRFFFFFIVFRWFNAFPLFSIIGRTTSYYTRPCARSPFVMTSRQSTVIIYLFIYETRSRIKFRLSLNTTRFIISFFFFFWNSTKRGFIFIRSQSSLKRFNLIFGRQSNARQPHELKHA